MSILTDSDLKDILIKTEDDRNDNNLMISPFIEDCLTPIGYDIRIGSQVVLSDTPCGILFLEETGSFKLTKGQKAFVTSLEKIGMPKKGNISGLILSKVSVTSKWLNMATTTIDADWSGNLLLAIRNDSNKEIILKYGDPICTAVFIENKSPATKRSNKDSGRNELIKMRWYEWNKKYKRTEIIKKLIPTILILSFLLIGILFMEPTTYLVVFISVGIALSNIIKEIFLQ